MAVNKDTLQELALSVEEYNLIVEKLGREPNNLELGLFGSLWSEHCGYKHSKPLLKMLPGTSPRTLVNAGEENAGAVDIGDGLAIVMKIESHNHPSAIEPYQGAATGVGGIIRDIFAMGARPIALLNSLRFGPLNASRTRYLFEGVVSGISGYGNCIGIPNVGGEVYFSSTYTGNPLVNAMCVGLLEKDKLVKATTGHAGNVLMLVGSDTGKDGIHGASGLASQTFEDDRELRPTVQVGNPFLEKILIEACLELSKTDHFVGMQDLGAAGLTSASVEAANNGGTGIEIDVDKVPRREALMSSYEVMLSESQERMLVIVKPGHEENVISLFEKWDLSCAVIGVATDDDVVKMTSGGVLAGEIPVSLLTNPPQYRLRGKKPKELEGLQNAELNDLPPLERDGQEILLELLGSPNICSKSWIYRQYDHQVQTNTVETPGGDAAVLRIKGTSKGIAMSTDGNGRLTYLDPFTGGMIAVAEACRNVSCVGAEPIALTDCLNFGDPDREEVYYQLEECIKGITVAATALNVPVISGNVSLYNESSGESIYPTPIIGSLGLFEDVQRSVNSTFKAEGDILIAIGISELLGDMGHLAGSEYLECFYGMVSGSPNIDLDKEVLVQNICRSLIIDGLVKSAHDCSEGGLAIAISESCILGGLGFHMDAQVVGDLDAALYGEEQSRIIISVDKKLLKEVGTRCYASGVPWMVLGKIGGTHIQLADSVSISLQKCTEIWNDSIERLMRV